VDGQAEWQTDVTVFEEKKSRMSGFRMDREEFSLVGRRRVGVAVVQDRSGDDDWARAADRGNCRLGEDDVQDDDDDSLGFFFLVMRHNEIAEEWLD
jgi:hypothetical protein